MAMNFDPFRELDRLTGSLLTGSGPRMAPMDLYRAGDHYVLNVDLPGVDPGSVDIDVDGSVLTIRAERTLGVPEGSQWLTRERQGGTFLRQLTLGEGLDVEHISAAYDSGVLSITIPVHESAKPRKIAVSSVRNAGQQLSVEQGASSGSDMHRDS